jgi:uncharacterized protein (TIGR02147 family)
MMREVNENISVDKGKTNSTPTMPHTAPMPSYLNSQKVLVNVFEFTDYREFLKAFYEAKKNNNASYSMSTFIRKAGLGQNSRGYLKLIIEGKRNLTAHTLRRFIEALCLPVKESVYFENLVYFNQAKTVEDREYYFQRLRASAHGKETQQFELLSSQYHYYTNWYFVAIRELVAVQGFNDDPVWIVKQLKHKITKKEAQEALVHLERLGMIQKNANGQWNQSDALVKYPGGVFNQQIQKFHVQMIDRAKEALTEDPYLERNASSITLSCDYNRIPEIIKRINRFRDEVTTEFGMNSKQIDTVVQMNIQLFQLTEIKTLPKKEKSQ